jgi:peptidoglycan/LPS O-acetylase OafA/YrhL
LEAVGAPLGRRHLALAVVAIVVASFAVRLVWPFAADTPFSLNLWEWPQMAVMFSFGVLAGERGWLYPPPSWLSAACARGGALGGAAVVVTGALVVGSEDADQFLGGPHVQALVEPLAEATLAVTMALWVALLFMRRATFDGRLARALGRASYPTYVVHPLVVVLLSAALASVAIVAELKFIVVAILGIVGAFGAGWILATLPSVAGRPPTRRRSQEQSRTM